MTQTSWLKSFPLLVLSFYLLLFCFPFPLTYIHNSIEKLEWMTEPLNLFAQWFGKTVMGIKDLKDADFYGSDSIFSYVYLLAIAVLSILMAVVVFALTHHSGFHRKLYRWAITFLRYYVGTYLFVFGCAMLFSFHSYDSTDLHTLEQTIGQQSAVYLFWNFIGYSRGYLFFCGVCHILIAVLLFFKKTTALGAFLALIFF